MRQLGIILILILTLCGCGSKKKITSENEHTIDSVIIERRIVDTMLITQADTATMRLLAECDEHGNALLSIIDDLSGKRVDINTQIKYIPVRDTTGMVKRDALISIEAIAGELAQQVAILEEKEVRYKEAIRQKNEQIDKKPVFSFNSFLWGGISGFILAGILFGIALFKIK